jgi:glutamate/aspartate transport system substrate-binding protein
MTRGITALTALLALALAQTEARGADWVGTLRKIKDTGSISLGYRDKTIPFSYVDDKKNVVGYSYELSTRIAEQIRQELQLPRIEIKSVPITIQNRFVMVTGGMIDMECTSTTNNKQRQERYAFSNNFFVINTRLMTRKDSGIRDFGDLGGKIVVVPAQTTSEELLKKLNAEKNLRMTIVSSTDRSTSPLTVMQAGQADAYMHDDAILYGQIANSWRPEEWVVTGTPMSHEVYGCMMRKDDPAFKASVDRAIARMMASGELRELYKKWFMTAIPPNGFNMNFPMSPEMERLFRTPHDRPMD